MNSDQKRNYNDGIAPQYETSDHVADLVWRAMNGVPADLVGRQAQRAIWIETCASVRHDYSIHKSMGGLAGCITLNDWLGREHEDRKYTALKQLLAHFAEAGFAVEDYMLVVWDLICKHQINAVMYQCKDLH